MSTDAEKVRAAADHIERAGLLKGSLYASRMIPSLAESREEYVRTHDVPCCTVGALQAYQVHRDDIRRGLAERLGELHRNPFFGDFPGETEWADTIPEWNDVPERTKDEVVAALRSFADSLDAQP